eukprot:TRINITY_DN21964_c0_g1_i1.p1 TRINITY_DN21964_c0_g1~~TRINITY_DN21964_c0_g1_i1.p1  ORF type:complete len:780 (+),score=109.58 TRINITY_DN21964_c0_g1_i1:106-2445(+)
MFKLTILTLVACLRVDVAGSDSVPKSHEEENCDMSSLLQMTAVSTQRKSPEDIALKQTPKKPKPELSKESLKDDDIHTIAELTGVNTNSSGDLKAFLSGLLWNVITCTGCMIAFSILRLRYPLMFAYNVVKGTAPLTPSSSFYGWFTGSLAVVPEKIVGNVGLDNALMLVFCNLCIRILTLIGLPMLFVMGPMHFFFGGDVAHKAGDNLSRISMGNVKTYHPWMYYLHALVVCCVCFTLKSEVWKAQEKFLQLRFDWLKNLPSLQSRTVLVQGIPEDHRSDAKVLSFFCRAFKSESVVQDAFVVKHLDQLENLAAARDLAEMSKRKAELEFKKHGIRPTVANGIISQAVGLVQGSNDGPLDAIDFYCKEIEKCQSLISEERARVKKEAEEVSGINSQSAFVTFKTRRDAEVAKELDYTPDVDEWEVQVAPESSTIIWEGLRRNENLACVERVIAYACTAGLYIGFMPICLAITNIAYQIRLGPLQPLWASLAPTIGLTTFLSFLPTVILGIFRTFFPMPARGFAQHKLQIWYFWFQVFFVILVTAVGSNVVEFIRVVSEHPTEMFSLLAVKLPSATHFYMNYLVIQWSAKCLMILRYSNLVKFFGFKALYSEDEAREMAEPEDQDYYGMGSRCARWTIEMLIGIIFSTLSPGIAILALTNFALTRIIFGYLIPFAETKKPDLGGVFWVTMLKHLLKGAVIYCVLMTGVLLKRAPNVIPGVISVCAMIYVIRAVLHFEDHFRWEKLPFVEIMNDEDMNSAPRSEDDTDTYEQPELREKLS